MTVGKRTPRPSTNPRRWKSLKSSSPHAFVMPYVVCGAARVLSEITSLELIQSVSHPLPIVAPADAYTNVGFTPYRLCHSRALSSMFIVPRKFTFMARSKSASPAPLITAPRWNTQSPSVVSPPPNKDEQYAESQTSPTIIVTLSHPHKLSNSQSFTSTTSPITIELTVTSSSFSLHRKLPLSKICLASTWPKKPPPPVITTLIFTLCTRV
mmetsp:Transcript_3641/g.4926  ORF Transcript_3641/g.4926 Transcript_3641/m.4926 type:complete len:211 (+) Transcript_3641:157-789(+)